VLNLCAVDLAGRLLLRIQFRATLCEHLEKFYLHPKIRR